MYCVKHELLVLQMDGTPSESGRFQLVSEDGNLSLALVKVCLHCRMMCKCYCPSACAGEG